MPLALVICSVVPSLVNSSCVQSLLGYPPRIQHSLKEGHVEQWRLRFSPYVSLHFVLSRIVLSTMESGDMTPKRSLVPEDGSAALLLLSMQAPRPMPPSISATTSKVLLQYLFETRIDCQSSTHTQKAIRDVTQTITSFLSWPKVEASTLSRAGYGPAKKRLKTRYYLESQSINLSG